MKIEDYPEAREKMKRLLRDMKRMRKELGEKKSANEHWIERWIRSFSCYEANNTEEYDRYQARIFESPN